MSKEIILYTLSQINVRLGLKYIISKLALTNASYYIPADLDIIFEQAFHFCKLKHLVLTIKGSNFNLLVRKLIIIKIITF